MASDTDRGRKARAERQLREELVIWLTTTSTDGTPQPNPVWFIPDGDDIIVYSHRNAVRNRNIQRNNRISLNFNIDPHDEHVTVITGTAAIDPTIPPPNTSRAYMEKYGEYIPGIDMTPESYAETFSVGLRIIPGKIRD
ncbi:MAG TPA: TIGR03667 family PPOX class F420-dependent oxidoreductase [Thermomicrobiales bacterium]|nr:TIGR03667 family PPOX class F420-dependent oxidoreductase [Thermomicrobiales bacterium]